MCLGGKRKGGKRRKSYKTPHKTGFASNHGMVKLTVTGASRRLPKSDIRMSYCSRGPDSKRGYMTRALGHFEGQRASDSTAR